MRKLALLALAAAAACSDTVPSTAPPLDRFYFPTGVALKRPSQPGDAQRTLMLVASSNFDLQYDIATGGTLLSVDVDATLPQPAPVPDQAVDQTIRPTVKGAVKIGSFAGEVAIVDDNTCQGWESEAHHPPLALVASRSQVKLYQVAIGADGSLQCGAGCERSLSSGVADPYGITVVCGRFPPVDANGLATGAPPTQQFLAFVTYLRAIGGEGFVSRVDLEAAQPTIQIDLGVSPTHASAFDPQAGRLYVTSRFAVSTVAPLRWIGLTAPGIAPDTFNVNTLIRGAETRSLALSSASAPAKRGYLATRVYSVDLANAIGGRPPTDIAGALAVLDLTEQPTGVPTMSLLRAESIGLGANEVVLVPRSGAQGDLVAVSSTDDGTVSLYDDAVGAVAKVFDICGPSGTDADASGPCQPGRAALGKNPFGLAAEPFTRGDIPGTPLARLYVGSFDRSWVNVIEVDPAHPASRTVNGVRLRWDRIGPERP